MRHRRMSESIGAVARRGLCVAFLLSLTALWPAPAVAQSSQTYPESAPAASPAVGGGNLRISGGVDLTWDGGTGHTGYILLKLDAFTATSSTINLPGTATSYHDAETVANALYCYVLAAVNGNVLVRLSDLLCSVVLGRGDFTLGLNGTTTATMTWTPPPGGVDAYVFLHVPLDGSGVVLTPLGPTATSMTATVNPSGSCFQVVAIRDDRRALTDLRCGVPGVATVFGGPNLASLRDVPAEVMRSLGAGDTVGWDELGQ